MDRHRRHRRHDGRSSRRVSGVPWRIAELDHVSAARAVYDATASAYAQQVGTELNPVFEGPVDRALLTAFVELAALTDAPVADVGCGPGRVAALLAAQGLHVVGVDVSQGMLAVAREAHPDIRFDEGLLTALPFAKGSLGGVVCWYSIIHTPPEHLHEVFAELKRVLKTGGHLLLAFQAGNADRVQRPDAYGTGISLTSYRHSPDAVITSLCDAGWQMNTRAVREPELANESTPQAFILARNTGPGR